MIIETLLENTATTGLEVTVGESGTYLFDVAGTFAGATVKLARKASDGTTWLDIGSDATFTAAGQVLVTIPAGSYKAIVSGGAPSGLYSKLYQVT